MLTRGEGWSIFYYMNTDEITAVVHQCTTNDRNGNPRRVYVALNECGHILGTEDEGYGGTPQWLRDLHDRGVWELRVEVTPAQYRRMVKLGDQLREVMEALP